MARRRTRSTSTSSRSPPTTLGHGHVPTPQEDGLHALAACINAAIATGAAARKIDLTSVSSTVTGDIDVRGVLGIDADIREGFGEIRIDFDVHGDADRETLDAWLHVRPASGLLPAGDRFAPDARQKPS